MTTEASAPVARQRRKNTRTRQVHHRPAIALSQVPPHQVDLTPGYEHMACPSCTTWVPLMHMHGTPRLSPHHTTRAGTPNPKRCNTGSHRIVVIDVNVRALQRRQNRRSREAMEPKLRRTAPEQSKPTPPPAKPVTRMTPKVPMTASDALVAYKEHLKRCRESGREDRCGGTRRCGTAADLARAYEQLLRNQPMRDHRALLEQTRARLLAARDERGQAVRDARARKARWQRSWRGADRADAARVPEAARRTTAPSHGPQVPIEPVRIAAR